MKGKFTKAIAKQIAEKSFDGTLDCIVGHSDPDFNLLTGVDKFEDNFTEDLEEMNIAVTPKRIEIINAEYEKLVAKAFKTIEKLYSKEAKK